MFDANGYTWASIKFSRLAVVNSVLVINRENTASQFGGEYYRGNNIRGSAIYIGSNPVPYQNTVCDYP